MIPWSFQSTADIQECNTFLEFRKLTWPAPSCNDTSSTGVQEILYRQGIGCRTRIQLECFPKQWFLATDNLIPLFSETALTEWMSKVNKWYTFGSQADPNSSTAFRFWGFLMHFLATVQTHVLKYNCTKLFSWVSRRGSTIVALIWFDPLRRLSPEGWGFFHFEREVLSAQSTCSWSPYICLISLFASVEDL